MIERELAFEQVFLDPETQSRQLAEDQAEEQGAEAAGRAERREKLRMLRAEDSYRAATHSGTEAVATRAEDQDAARDHVETGRIPASARHRDHPATHGEADFVAGIATDQ